VAEFTFRFAAHGVDVHHLMQKTKKAIFGYKKDYMIMHKPLVGAWGSRHLHFGDDSFSTFQMQFL